MLYDCWLQVAKSRQSEMALFDLANGRRWTFAALKAESERGQEVGRVLHPSGRSADFVIEVLRAWRLGQVVCPLEAGQPAPDLHPQQLPGNVAHLKTTSASTGKPQVILFTGAQLKADADNIVATMGLREEWPNIGLISLGHSYGFSNLVLPLLLHGIPLVLGPSGLPEVLKRAANEVQHMTVAAVPALWRAWLEAKAIPQKLRLAISAGAPLPVELERAVWEQTRVKVHNFYGSSECGGIAYDPEPVPREQSACAGMPLKNVKVQTTQDGCIEVQSSAVGETYWPKPSEALGRGVFRTSDLGEVKDGRVYLLGRLGDQINIAGRKVLPEEIEQVLRFHPQVRACLAFGVPSVDTGRGEMIVACIETDGIVSGENLKQFALARLPAWQVPREWWFVDSLEANARGKLSRVEWRRRYLERA